MTRLQQRLLVVANTGLYCGGVDGGGGGAGGTRYGVVTDYHWLRNSTPLAAGAEVCVNVTSPDVCATMPLADADGVSAAADEDLDNRDFTASLPPESAVTLPAVWSIEYTTSRFCDLHSRVGAEITSVIDAKRDDLTADF